MIKEKDFFDTENGLNLSVLNLSTKPDFPDYNESIVNLSNSILNYYGCPIENKTLPLADSILAKSKKHIAVIILDGLGVNILEQHLHYKDFLRRNFCCEYSSVFPPTTVAATTSFLSGKYPIEHGWLGWDCYFSQEDKTVTCFTNNLQGTKIPASTDYNIPYKYLPYENITEKINKTKNAKAYMVVPFGNEPHSELDDWIETIKKHCHKEERNFVYAYWDEPDTTLHRYGTKSDEVSKVIKQLNAKMLYLCESCPETTFIITADHGHIDIHNEILCQNYQNLSKMLIRKPCIEPRALSFFVKKEYMQEFPKEFVKHFGTDYVLFTKQEALEKELFGPGKQNKNCTTIGDFTAVAFSEKTLVWNKESKQFYSHHAGLNKKELQIPLISYEHKAEHSGLIIYYGLVAMLVAFFIMIII